MQLHRTGRLFYLAEQMAQVDTLGEFEQVVLLTILRLKENAYGFTIGAEIAARTGRKPSPGALYATLDRLRGQGLCGFAGG